MAKEEERKEDLKDQNKSFISKNKTAAINAYYGQKTLRPLANSGYGRVSIVHPYCVAEFNVCVPEMVRCFEDTFGSSLRNVIRAVAASYYVTDDNDIEGIYNAVIDILEKSAEGYATICSTFRRQNSKHLEDDLHRPIHLLFAQSPNSSIGPLQDAMEVNSSVGEFAATNDFWANNILKYLQHFYLNDTLRTQFEWLFINTFKLQRDDATVRFASVNPQNFEINTVAEPMLNKDTLEDYLAKLADQIDNYFNDYTMMADVMSVLGLTTGSKFDFTRDLKGITFFVEEDRYGDVEAMLYAVATGHFDYENTGNYGYPNGIISKPTSDANWNWKDKSLEIDKRVEINVLSMTNWLRKACEKNDIVYLEQLVDTQDGTLVYKIERRFQGFVDVEHSDMEHLTATEIMFALHNNLYNAFLDPVGVGYVTNITAISAEGATTSEYQIHLGLSDYVMNEADISSVCAQVSYDMVFANCELPEIVKYKSVTTDAPAAGDYAKSK